MIQSPCFYCGSLPSPLNGIDRRVSATKEGQAAYTPENCVPCCKMCNYFKSSAVEEAFLAHLNKIKAKKAWMEEPTLRARKFFTERGRINRWKADIRWKIKKQGERGGGCALGGGRLQDLSVVTLTEAEYLNICRRPCLYCACVPHGTAENGLYTGSVDRYDNLKGYTPPNCVASCKMCNLMKSDLAPDRFLAHVDKILLHWKGL